MICALSKMGESNYNIDGFYVPEKSFLLRNIKVEMSSEMSYL